MKRFNYDETLATDTPIAILDCSAYPDCTVPDLNVDLYEMLVRQQNGEITTLGGMIRQDAQYSSDEDIADMRVAPDNDPDLNLITARHYAEYYDKRVGELIEEDNAIASKSSASESEPSHE